MDNDCLLQNNFISSFNDDYGNPWDELVHNFSVNDLEKLKDVFTTTHEARGLSKEDFFNVINELYSENDYGTQSIALFDHILKDDNTTITWTDFVTFLMEDSMPTASKTLFLQTTNIVTVPQTKRETTVKIVLIETQKYFCYAMVSKHGRVGLYDGSLNFLTTYQLIMTREDINRKEENRRRRNRWVTDAIFCADTLTFIVTNTTRSVVIYEASGLKHVPLWLILSTPNIVECFAYKSCEISGVSTLFMGDDSGVVMSLTFLQPKISLLRKKHNDKINLFYWDELPDETDFIIVKRIGRPHQENIKQLIYFEDNETLLSCSKDSNISLIVKYIGNKNPPYIFKMSKGCNCFALSRERKVLVTGSENGVVRLWNPIITSKPIGILHGHQAAVMDVKIMDKANLFMSCSREGLFKLWCIDEQKCLQSFTINFPSFTIFGKLIEWGTQCIYPGPKRKLDCADIWERSPILVSCCNHVAILQICYKDKQTENGENMQILPPPPLQNSVLVPKMWRILDNADNSSDSDREIKEETIDSTILEKRLSDLKFILEKDLFEYNEGSKSDINFKIATLERKKLDMQHNVALGAPYLALNLHEVENLRLSPNLPVPNRKRVKNIVENIQRVLDDANCRDIVFSEPSSSRSPRSSRSSFVEFEY